jgi:hypothetical protein
MSPPSSRAGATAASTSSARATRRSPSSSRRRGTTTPRRGGHRLPRPAEDRMSVAIRSGKGSPAAGRSIDAARSRTRPELEFDVVVVGSGAGRRRHRRVLSAGGALGRDRRGRPAGAAPRFRMREREAYPRLYQESAGARRATRRSPSCRALRRRRHHGELDLQLPHPPQHLAHWNGVRAGRLSERRACPVVRAHGERLSIAPWRSRPTRTTTSCAAAA